MPEIATNPEPSQGPRPRDRRPTIGLAMIAVTVVAAALGLARYKTDYKARQARHAQLRAEWNLAESRMVRSQKLQTLGYVTSAQATADRLTRDQAKAALKAFEGP